MSVRNDFYVYALFRENGVPFYVGRGRGRRWLHHEGYARSGLPGHKSGIIREMQVRGVDVIKTKLHEGLTETVARAYEIALIAAIGRGESGPLVNLTDGSGRGSEHSAAARAKIGATHRGKKKSPESIAKRTLARRGWKMPPEGVAKTAAHNRGRALSPEHRAKVGAAQLGRTRSLETRANMSAAQRGRMKSPEHRAKISAVQIGRKLSPESIAKREATKARNRMVGRG